MRRKYETPDFDFVRLTFSNYLLNISDQGENAAEHGNIVAPGENEGGE